MITKEGITWAAGLFEGEGCITTATRKNKPRKLDGEIYYATYLVAKISMCDKDVLEKLANTLGIGIVKGPYYHKRNKKAKPLYHWQAWNKEAYTVMDLLSPFLCSRRIAQYKIAKAKCGHFNAKVNKRKELHKFGPGSGING